MRLTHSFTRIPPIIGKAIADLSSEQFAYRPASGTNTIAWLAWHSARGQDVQIADLADTTEQIWTVSGWYGRFALPFGPDEMGYGMSQGEVTRVIATEALVNGYLTAGTEASIAYLGELSAVNLDEVIDPNWNPPVTRGARLVSVINDCLQHAGQASYARGMLDRT
ncbi:hypothetical protein GCM10007382_16980 [Salinibacterium xinjiangense]|uniref:Uncharacterized damage-inducible protein DinB (Forms a four-helix bundle) n=1 Tax=Salinibacterium xinjiangense TaxID=386302 RepID=A0A2C8YIJ6_9MICO|nr:DUF664 domain-containing protein [Salinibacterium xinjiangense]GGK97339.1 hypothetical protein GCM10007382_16980 [Salinibacterium xinjiangense]SOE50237.1 Uncharacterized damage-inducible protein DinB (forms a four-helix bundle) [Salinibacterium xinjiangense]